MALTAMIINALSVMLAFIGLIVPAHAAYCKSTGAGTCTYAYTYFNGNKHAGYESYLYDNYCHQIGHAYEKSGSYDIYSELPYVVVVSSGGAHFAYAGSQYDVSDGNWYCYAIQDGNIGGPGNACQKAFPC